MSLEGKLSNSESMEQFLLEVEHDDVINVVI